MFPIGGSEPLHPIARKALHVALSGLWVQSQHVLFFMKQHIVLMIVSSFDQLFCSCYAPLPDTLGLSLTDIDNNCSIICLNF